MSCHFGNSHKARKTQEMTLINEEDKMQIAKHDLQNYKDIGTKGVEINGKPYIVASNVTKALGYKRPNDTISQHCKYITQRYIPHP